MKPLSFFRRTAAFATAAVIAATVVFGFSPSEIRLWADEQDELEQKLEENKQKQAELDKKIKATRGDISKEKENQEAISEQIKTTEDYIRDLLSLIKNYDGEIEALETDITNLQGDIEIQQAKVENKRAEIDENIVLYEQRIRAMYLSGNDSVASIILGSTDFFDMLMKIELVKRIADYDNELITSLLQMKSEYEAEQLELENQRSRPKRRNGIPSLRSSRSSIRNRTPSLKSLKSSPPALKTTRTSLRRPKRPSTSR